MKLINIDIWQLLDISETKKIICFGAGRHLENFMNQFEMFHIVDRVCCVLDNDERKNNSTMTISGKLLNVYSFSQFQNMDMKDYIMMITSTYVCEIMELLDKCEQLKDVLCCYSGFVWGMTEKKEETERYCPKDLRIYDALKIPKKIHYCWFGGNAIPEQNRIWMETWREY